MDTQTSEKPQSSSRRIWEKALSTRAWAVGAP